MECSLVQTTAVRAEVSSFHLPRVAALVLSVSAITMSGVAHSDFRPDQFVDVASSAGLDYTGETYGASWGDIDGDRLPDLWVGNHGYRSNGGSGLFRNTGSETFANVTSALAGFRQYVDVHGAAWADFDNDGEQDLYVTTGAREETCLQPDCGNQLFVNDGGSFSDHAAEMGLDYYVARARTPIWFDYNGDGLLDVFVASAPGTGGDFSKLFTNQISSFGDLHDALGGSRHNRFAQLS